MQKKILTSFDNLNLGNLNDKLKTMRDKLRNDINQDVQYMHLKMSLDDDDEHPRHPSQPNSQDNASSRNAQDAIEEFSNVSNRQSKQDAERESELQPQSSGGYLNIELAEIPVDLQEIKRLAGKKISEAYWDQYIRCTLKEEIVEKIKQLFEETEDVDEKVQTREFILKINRLGVKFSESTAVEVPLLKRRLNLKKVLFELYFKAKIMPDRITWMKFKEALQDYRYPNQPSIDQYMISESMNGQKAKNYFNITPELVNELKVIYQRCSKDIFLNYCPLKSLVDRLHQSKIIQNNLNVAVRPKSNYEVEQSLKDTISYITNYAPQFVDLDEFLLFFTVKGFTYYPIQQRFHANAPTSANSIKRVKSEKIIVAKPKKQGYFEEYELSTTNANSIRNNKLQLMLKEQQQKKQSEVKKTFKAKPMPKSISKEKYQQFMNNLNHNIESGRKTLESMREQSGQQLERLKKETKLFVSPRKKQIQYKSYQITARQPPQSIKQPKLEEIEVQKASRRNKIFSQTQFKYQKSWRELPLVATTDLSPKCREYEIRQNYQLEIRDIPDYRAEQQRIQDQLRERKLQFEPTQPDPFYFHTEARHPKREYLQHSQSPQPLKHYDYKEIIYSPEPQIYYTQKFADMVVANKKRVYQKEKEINQKLQQEAQRLKKHYNFAKFMKSNLAKLPNTAQICENEAKMKIERHKKYWKNLDRQHEANLNDLYAKILQRPFLYEMQSAKSPNRESNPIKPPKETIKPKKNKKKNGKAQVNRSF